MLKKFPFLLAAGVVLSFSAVAFAQPLFGPPQNLGPKINSSSFEFDPFLTADGRRLFFVSNRPTGFGQEDIYFSEWTDTGWTTAQPLGSQINSGRREKSPSVSPDGQKLYYIDAERGGYNWDVWVSTWDSSQSDWGVPQNVGPPVNTTGVEFSVHIGPDGHHLYFSSSAVGRCGFYVSEWNGTSWSEPVQFPDPQNCNTGEYPSITADSVWFYFDHFVSDGISSFVRHWNGLTWEPAVDLRPQIGERSTSPYIVSSGDSLLFGSSGIGGFGFSDIFIMPRVVLGDLNLDGRLTTTDVVLELNAVFLDSTFPAPFEAADCNCDGQLRPSDVVMLLLATFTGTPFPCRI